MTEMEHFSIESCVRGYQVYEGIWEASSGEELQYRHSNGVVRASLYRLILPLLSSITAEGRLVTEDPVDPGHCQRDTSTIESYSESRLST